MKTPLTTTVLEAFLDESLPVEETTAIEAALRHDPALLKQLGAIHSRRDAGVHTLGEIWRRRRVSCPSREQLGSFLLGAIDSGVADYITFHLEVIGCRYCQANRADLEHQQRETRQQTTTRRKKFFETSAGLLKARG